MTQDCVFCKIIAGQIPCYKVFEDDHFLGFLDIRPYNPGNALIIPKKHYRWVDDVPNFGDYFEAAKAVGMAAKKELGAFAVSYATLGFEVPHAHIRVIPRFENDGHGGWIDWNNVKDIPKQEMKTIADKLLSFTHPA